MRLKWSLEIRLSEVLVKFYGYRRGPTPPALAQRRKKKKGDSDDEEASGPDPAGQKTLLTLKRQFNKSEKRVSELEQ